MRHDRYRIAGGTNTQFDIGTRLLIYFHEHGRYRDHLEAVPLRSHRIGSRQKIVDAITAVGVGRGGSGKTNRIVTGDDDHALDACGFFVANVAQQGAGGDLSKGGKCQEYESYTG